MDRKGLFWVVAFSVLAVCFAEKALAIHGVGIKKSISWPYGSSLDCVLGIGEATLTFVADAPGSPSGSIILQSVGNKSSRCDIVTNGGKEPAQFKLDITAARVQRTCKATGPNTSTATFTQECGAGADTTGNVTEVVTGGSARRTLPIAGMAPLNNRQCEKVFPEDNTGSQPLDIGVTLVTKAYYTQSSNCKGKKPADGPIALRMCNGYLGKSGSSCLDAHGNPKKPGKGDLDQLDPVALACQQKEVKQDCDTDSAGVVEATIDGKDIDVRTIDTGSLACGDISSTPAAKFQFGFFVGTKENEDLKVTCHRCVNGQFVAPGGKLAVTGDTKGVTLEKGLRFAVNKFGGSCSVILAP